MGSTYGVDFWASVQVTRGGDYRPGSAPCRRIFVERRGFAVIGHRTGRQRPDARAHAEVDHGLRALDHRRDAALCRKLPSPESPAYTELGARVAWRASDALELSVNGSNLLDDTHAEYALPTARAIRRSIYGEVRWTF
jgi:hypothetical protein